VKATAEARDHPEGDLLVKGSGLVVPEKDVKPPSRPRGFGTHEKKRIASLTRTSSGRGKVQLGGKFRADLYAKLTEGEKEQIERLEQEIPAESLTRRPACCIVPS
jgi:hypothetical protein